MKLLILIEKQLDYLQQGILVQQIQKVVNFLKNSGPPKEGLNKIGFMHNL